MTYAGDVFMAAGYSGLFITSPVGTNWTRRDPPVTRFLYDGAYFAGAYWISGGGSNFYKTTDFIDWERVGHQGNESATVFVNTGEALFSAGRLGTLVKTTDGETWENQQGGLTKDFSDLLFAHGRFIASNHNGEIFVSEDGNDW